MDEAVFVVIWDETFGIVVAGQIACIKGGAHAEENAQLFLARHAHASHYEPWVVQQ